MTPSDFPDHIGRMTEETIPEAALLADVLAFCERYAIAESAFGKDAVNDKSLIPDIRTGRELRRATRQRVRAFMQEYIALVAADMPPAAE